MKIHYLVFRPDSLTFTIVKALSYGRHTIHVWVADPKQSAQLADSSLQRVAEIPGVKIINGDKKERLTKIERLIIQVYPRLIEQSQAITSLLRSAQKITLITAGDRSQGWRKTLRLQWLELSKLTLRIGRVDSIAYKDGFYPFDLYKFLKPRQVVGFDVHSQFLLDDKAFQKIHAQDWSPETSRPILANFLGSSDPDVRKRILDSVRLHFSPPNPEDVSSPKSMFWHEYSDATSGGVGPNEFLDVLSRSDFTLCPPGYSLVTHRPMEALLRGSIPVLNNVELDFYDIGLEGGVNCVSVPPGQWATTVERLQCISEEKLIEMRFNISSIFETHLDYATSSRRMCSRLGIKGLHE